MHSKIISKFKFSFSKIDILKITVIGIVGFYLLFNFIPFYDSADGYTLATIGMKLSQGQYAITNELLEKTGKFEFKPGDWANTIDPTNAIPLGPIGFHFWAAFLYFTTNNFGLFYFGPISGIILLIVAERISTKLFGKYVGLLTLLFIATNHIFLRASLSFQTENTAAILFLLGFYFMIQFLKTRYTYTIFLTSLFFSIATLVRINSVVFFPTELIFVGLYFIFFHFKNKSSISLFKQFIKNSNLKKIGLLVLPWTIFFLFWFGYHDAFFGDPFTTQIIIQRGAGSTNTEFSSFFELETRHFENAKQYSKYLLPYQFPALESSVFSNYDDLFGKFWLGIVSFFVIIIGLVISLKKKQHRKEIVAITFFIISTVWFYSALTSEERASFGVPGRYMFPAFVLFYMLLSFVILKIFSFDGKSKKFVKSISYLTKASVLIILIVFFSSAFYFTPYGQSIMDGTFKFNDPFELSKEHPPSLEGLTKNSVVVALKTDRILEYDLIPFQIVPVNDEKAPDDSISLLVDTINDGYSVYIFKQPTTIHEKIILQDLQDNHKFIFKDHSKSFCKVTVNSDTIPQEKSDSICVEN